MYLFTILVPHLNIYLLQTEMCDLMDIFLW